MNFSMEQKLLTNPTMKVRKEPFTSNLKRKNLDDDGIKRENVIIDQLNPKTGKEVNLAYNKSDVTLLADKFQSFLESWQKEGRIYPHYFLCLQAYTWEAELKSTNLESEFIQNADIFLSFRKQSEVASLETWERDTYFLL